MPQGSQGERAICPHCGVVVTHWDIGRSYTETAYGTERGTCTLDDIYEVEIEDSEVDDYDNYESGGINYIHCPNCDGEIDDVEGVHRTNSPEGTRFASYELHDEESPAPLTPRVRVNALGNFEREEVTADVTG